jgi:hypothetical protein
MTKLSVRQFLQSRGADPSQGIRHLAPALNTISLRSLLTMKRIIIHLSDLHIGKNDAENDSTIKDSMGGTSAYDQAQTLISAIITNYENENPKPIVVITGDLVDYCIGTHNYLDMTKSLLDELSGNGFAVFVTPGNHDYSDEIDIDKISWAESNPVVNWAFQIKSTLENVATSKGSSPNKVTGITYVDDARTTFINTFGGKKQGAYDYLHSGYYLESWKDKGAAFDLAFINIDAQDTHANCPSEGDFFSSDSNPFIGVSMQMAELADLHPKFFLNNKFLRLSYGYIDEPTFASFKSMVDQALSKGAKPIVCLHYWINYGVAPLLAPEEAAVVAILNLIQSENFDKDSLFELVNLMNYYAPSSYGMPPVITKCTPANPNFNGYGESSLWNELESVGIVDTQSKVTWSNLVEVLNNCHLLLVGHRHVPNKLQTLGPDKIVQKGLWQTLLNLAKEAKKKYTGNDLVNRINGAMSDIQKIEDHLKAFTTDLQSWSYIGGTPPEPVGSYLSADQIASLIENINLDAIDLDARYNPNPVLANYHEAGSPLPDPGLNKPWNSQLNWSGSYDNPTNDQANPFVPYYTCPYISWAELTINLQTGVVSHNQLQSGGLKTGSLKTSGI